MNKRLEVALALANNNQMQRALEQLKALENDQECREPALQLSVKIALATKNYSLAKTKLMLLCQLNPRNFQYLSTLVDISISQQDIKSVCEYYRTFLDNNSNHAVAWFNYAYYLKKIGKFEAAITGYKQALNLNISAQHELYLNMSVIYADHLRDDVNAKLCLQKAIEIHPSYSDAMYNLGNLFEQQGDKEQAHTWFIKAYDADSSNTDAIARIADLKKFSSEDDAVIKKLEQLLHHKNLHDEQRSNLLFALGKAYDDCQRYEQAFSHYSEGNKLDKDMYPKYDKTGHSQFVNSIIEHYSAEKFTSNTDENGRFSPIFICGMFRSGSTLTEQVLAAHPAITAGGEIDFFPRFIANSPLSYPEGMAALSSGELETIANNYTEKLQHVFPDAGLLTDKRPDNFLYLGMIKQLFPRAKIVFTERNMLDNCLSVFFLRLGASMNYSTSIIDAKHYYQEQQRLLRHWQTLFGDDIFVCRYEQLIETPKQHINELLTFLGLDWSDSCMRFYNIKNTVKTASVWQVRQPLYTSSSGRWKNYAAQLGTLGVTLPKNEEL